MNIGDQFFCRIVEIDQPFWLDGSCFKLLRDGLADPDALCCCLQIDAMHYDASHFYSRINSNYIGVKIDTRLMFYPGQWIRASAVCDGTDSPIEHFEFKMTPESGKLWENEAHALKVAR